MPISDFQSAMLEVWRMSEAQRREVGMKPRQETALFRKSRVSKDKSVFLGTRRYKLTLWLSYAHYGDILRSKIADRFQGSLTKYLYKMIEDACPSVTPRPISRIETARKLMEKTKLRNGTPRRNGQQRVAV